MREDRVNAILHTLIHLKQKDNKADIGETADTILFAFLSKIREAGLTVGGDGTNLVSLRP